MKAKSRSIKMMLTGILAKTKEESKVKLVGQALDVSPLLSDLVCHAQTQGLGTALKILFSENLIEKIPESGPSYGFQLTRQEIVALFNAFGRLV